MSKFLLSLLCSQSGIVSSASWGSHRLGEAVLSYQQGTEPACLSQLLSQHPRDPPTSTSASLSFSERLVKLSDQSTCQMPGSRRAPQGWTELSEIQTGPSFPPTANPSRAKPTPCGGLSDLPRATPDLCRPLPVQAQPLAQHSQRPASPLRGFDLATASPLIRLVSSYESFNTHLLLQLPREAPAGFPCHPPQPSVFGSGLPGPPVPPLSPAHLLYTHPCFASPPIPRGLEIPQKVPGPPASMAQGLLSEGALIPKTLWGSRNTPRYEPQPLTESPCEAADTSPQQLSPEVREGGHGRVTVEPARGP